MHPGPHHAALLYGAEDLVDAEADGLYVCVLLQMHPQYPHMIHGHALLPQHDKLVLPAPLHFGSLWVSASAAQVLI